MSIGTRLSELMNFPPKVYQLYGIRFLDRNKGCAVLADDMGLGKTYMTTAYLALHPEIRPAVIVCPSSLKYGWERELKKHASLKSEVLEGRTPYPTKGKILILNYEILLYWEAYLKKIGAQLYVFDECHKISNRQAKTTKASLRLALRAKHRIPLSGTPILNGPVNYWPPLRMVRPRLFESFSQYAWSFCDPKEGFRGLDLRGCSNGKKLHRLIRPFVLRRLKREVDDELPRKRKIVLPVEITNRREYIRARDDFVEWLAEKGGAKAVQSAKGALALVQLGKLKQVAAHGKLKACIEWIKDFLSQSRKRKLVVFAVHSEILDRLEKAFPDAAVLRGKTPTKKRQKAIDRFQQNSRCRLFLGQLKAAGQGLTLTRADTTLTIEFGWNQATHDQADDRVNRIGQTSRHTEHYYMIGRNTIDEWNLELIHSKQVGINEVLEGNSSVSKSLMKLLERFQ